jgi:rhodanese-related sulfurtransferase
MTEYIPLEVEDYKAQFKDENKDHVLLDVRTVEEFEQARIPGAVNIPLDQLKDRTAEVPADKPIVVVCRTGVRSIMGAQVLRYAGFKIPEIYNLEGGTVAWVRHGWGIDSGGENGVF